MWDDLHRHRRRSAPETWFPGADRLKGAIGCSDYREPVCCLGVTRITSFAARRSFYAPAAGRSITAMLSILVRPQAAQVG
jgi:hypothetical protein